MLLFLGMMGRHMKEQGSLLLKPVGHAKPEESVMSGGACNVKAAASLMHYVRVWCSP